MDIEEAIEDDRLETESLSDIVELPYPNGVTQEPVVIRGNGNLTVFGLNNRFCTDFPPSLLARVAPEEFQATVEKINSLLRTALPLQMKWIVFGCLCCCCTLGCSFWPVVCMSKKTRLSIEKLLEWENSHLYRRLGLKWRLSQMHIDSSSMLEYVLVIDFVPNNLTHTFVDDLVKMKIIKDFILRGDAEPVVFRKIHVNWLPVTWTLDEWGRILSGHECNEILSVRCGRQGATREIQWESTCKKLNVTWKMLSEWDSSEELQLSEVSNLNWWLYYDYKYMAHFLPAQELQKFSWAALGFPERGGKDSTLWIGTRGSYTPCHFDTYGCNLVCQVFGRKKWILFPPQDTEFLRPTRVPYEESSVYSEINLANLTDNDVKKLSSCTPVEVTLEPGDVLFVPPKWWHFVKSEEFSISVNTWIELPDDTITRLQEAVMRTVMNFAVNAVSPNSVSDLLNPNEMELLDMTESDLKDLLQSSYNQVTSKHTQNEEEILISQEADCPPAKISKLTEPCFKSSLHQLQTSVSCVEELKSTKLSVKNVANNSTYGIEPPTDEKAYLKHVINAIGHPSVLKHISEQFFRNISDA